jgi:hypothetical protein
MRTALSAPTPPTPTADLMVAGRRAHPRDYGSFAVSTAKSTIEGPDLHAKIHHPALDHPGRQLALVMPEMRPRSSGVPV